MTNLEWAKKKLSQKLEDALTGSDDLLSQAGITKDIAKHAVSNLCESISMICDIYMRLYDSCDDSVEIEYSEKAFYKCAQIENALDDNDVIRLSRIALSGRMTIHNAKLHMKLPQHMMDVVVNRIDNHISDLMLCDRDINTKTLLFAVPVLIKFAVPKKETA